MLEKASANPLLGLTACWAAGARASESLREDCLFNDRWAAALAGMAGKQWVERHSGAAIAVRTRFFDDFLLHVTGQQAIGQVVLIAAGLDTRAFRLTWPTQTHLFELDQAQVLRYKEQILTAAGARPTCKRKALGVDLTSPWRETLLKSGFNAQQSSVWLLEGLLYYLSNENLTRLLDAITGLAVPGSWIGFDVVSSDMLTSPWTRSLIADLANSGIPWLGSMDDPEQFLATRGWKATLTQAGEEEANYGRWPHPVMPRTVAGVPRNWLVIAQKK